MTLNTFYDIDLKVYFLLFTCTYQTGILYAVIPMVSADTVRSQIKFEHVENQTQVSLFLPSLFLKFCIEIKEYEKEN